MNNIVMLIRREFWENRSLWIAPLVISGVLLLSAALGGIHVGEGNDISIGFLSPAERENLVDVDLPRSEQRYAKTLAVFTSIQMFTLGIAVFFYLLDALLTERKDRSILFWKSLPISDAEVVGSKVLTGLVAAPVYVLLVSAATHILFALVWSLRSGGPPDSEMLAWDGSTWLQVQAAFWMLAPAVIVWYLPLAGYALLVSVWARKNAFLWALLPPASILAIEGLLRQSTHFGQWLLDRFVGVFRIVLSGPDRSASDEELGELLRRVGDVFTDTDTWLGVLVAAVMFVVIVRFRRYRDDS